MKGYIIYIEGHKKSTQQAKQSLKSFRNFGWDVELRAGITPENVKKTGYYDRRLVPNGRLDGFKKENINTFETKLSCFSNHLNFWKEVVDADEPMCFLEHDSICISEFPKVRFNDYLLLNCKYVFSPPSALAQSKFMGFEFPDTKGVNPFPFSYPLKYYKKNIFHGSDMAPGTASYAITPKGAKKLLDASDKYGLDQSDFFINSFNVEMNYITPSLVKFNDSNLQTSHGFVL